MAPYAEAWHEAGHAVAAHLYGGRVRLLTLESPDENQDGAAAIEWGDMDPRRLARCTAAVALAGPLAELAFGDSGDWESAGLHAAWRSDWEEAEASLVRLESEPNAREELRRALVREVRSLLDVPAAQDAVIRVADALDAHRTLDEGLFEDAAGL